MAKTDFLKLREQVLERDAKRRESIDFDAERPAGGRRLPPAYGDELYVKFISRIDELDNIVDRVGYFLDRLPETRGLQPDARNLAAEMKRAFKVLVAAARTGDRDKDRTRAKQHKPADTSTSTNPNTQDEEVES